MPPVGPARLSSMWDRCCVPLGGKPPQWASCVATRHRLQRRCPLRAPAGACSLPLADSLTLFPAEHAEQSGAEAEQCKRARLRYRPECKAALRLKVEALSTTGSIGVDEVRRRAKRT